MHVRISGFPAPFASSFINKKFGMVALPRYKLGVGNQLTYRMSSAANSEVQANGMGRPSRFSIDWNFFVIDRHREGLWRVVFAESRTQGNESDSGDRTVRTIDNDGFFDIADDGRLVENWTITPLANPTVIFPQLPADQSQIASGWQSRLQLDGAHRHYVSATSDAAQDESIWQFVENCQTHLDPIYQVRRQRNYAFDLQQGLVTRVTTALQRGGTAGSDNVVSTDSIHLVEVVEPASNDSAVASEEADRYFKLCAEYQRLIDLALWDLPQSSHWLEQAACALEQFEPTVRVEFIRELLQRKLKLHQRECGSLLSDAEKLVGIIDTPALDWQSVDLNGNTHALKGYLGKVVVLCFWNRGCTWSIRALLALKAVADELRGQPIAFLGVNEDRDIKDADFVWQALKFPFPAIIDLYGEDSISRRYGVDSCPTTVVIDQNGIIRRIRAGYSYHLSCSLALDLRRLVSETPCVTCE